MSGPWLLCRKRLAVELSGSAGIAFSDWTLQERAAEVVDSTGRLQGSNLEIWLLLSGGFGNIHTMIYHHISPYIVMLVMFGYVNLDCYDPRITRQDFEVK